LLSHCFTDQVTPLDVGSLATEAVTCVVLPAGKGEIGCVEIETDGAGTVMAIGVVAFGVGISASAAEVAIIVTTPFVAVGGVLGAV